MAILRSQIRTCSDEFENIKNRLILVETSFNENLKDLHEVINIVLADKNGCFKGRMNYIISETDLRRKSRRSSSCHSLSDKKSKEEILLNVGDLEGNFEKVKSSGKIMQNKR